MRNLFRLLCLLGMMASLPARSETAPPPPPKKDPEKAGQELRLQALTTPAAKIHKAPTDQFPLVYGVLMDWPTGPAIATVFAGSSGVASLYTNTNFNVIGGEAHESVRLAAVKMVLVANRHFAAATPTQEFPYPAPGHVRFYLLTYDGVRVLDVEQSELKDGTSKYGELFDLGQAVMSELRMVYEKGKK